MTSKLLKFLPGFIRNKIEHRPNLIKILDNIGWLFFDRILRMGVGLLVGVWIARYLGPEQFGLLNFAMAFVGLFGAIAYLGLPGIMIRDMVSRPEQTSETMGTGFVLHIAGALAAYMMILGVIVYLRPDDTLAKTIVAVLGFTLVFNSAGVAIKCWFESQVMSKFCVWVENSVFLVIAVVKVVMILSDAPLMAFVWAFFAEAFIVAVLLLLVYTKKTGAIIEWKPDFTRGKELLRDSWPLILAGVATSVYMKIDQIMLGQMIGDQAVGVYSAAVKISEIWYFFPMAIVASVFPSIIEAKKQSEELYYQRLQKLYDLMVWISIAIALPMTFISSWVVLLLYGQAYLQAGPVLAIHIWAAVFVFLGVASMRWFLTENKQILHLKRTILGAIANVGLNLYMIPHYGVIGAAYSTIISYSIALVFFDLLQKETRSMFKMKINSFNLWRIVKLCSLY